MEADNPFKPNLLPKTAKTMVCIYLAANVQLGKPTNIRHDGIYRDMTGLTFHALSVDVEGNLGGFTWFGLTVNDTDRKIYSSPNDELYRKMLDQAERLL